MGAWKNLLIAAAEGNIEAQKIIENFFQDREKREQERIEQLAESIEEEKSNKEKLKY